MKPQRKLKGRDAMPFVFTYLRHHKTATVADLREATMPVSDALGLIWRPEAANWALDRLKKEGLADNPDRRGVWSITAQGATRPPITFTEAREIAKKWNVEDLRRCQHRTTADAIGIPMP